MKGGGDRSPISIESFEPFKGQQFGKWSLYQNTSMIGVLMTSLR
jgi:hypothetical protein